MLIMKGKARYWPLFLTSVLVAMLLLTGRAAYRVWGYLRLDGSAPVKVERWEVERLGTDRYGLVAHYTFDYQGQPVTTSSHWRGKRLLNRMAAEAKIVRLKEAPLVAYFPVKHPEEAVLERTFPLKACIYALVALGIMIYFYILALYVRRSGTVNG